MTQTDDDNYSKFRDFLVPLAQNNLESARDSHQRGEYDRAERNLDATENVVRECREQLKKDREDAD